MSHNNTRTDYVFGSVLMVIIIIVVIFIIRANNSNDTSEIPDDAEVVIITENTTLQPQVSETENTQNVIVPDGEFSQTGFYSSQAGNDSIEVTVAVADGIIQSIVVTSNAIDPTSKEYQQAFIDGIQEKVIGKPIQNLALQTVNGASLTTVGFNNAMVRIQQQYGTKTEDV